MQVALSAIILVLLYQRALFSYWQENYYQEHFVYLWVFLAVSLSQSLRPPFRGRFTWKRARDVFGISLVLLAILLLVASELAGSATAMRSSLVVFLTGTAVLAVPNWELWRCLLHGVLLQLCFGLPHTVFFSLTKHLQDGVASIAAWPARMGLMDYEVNGASLQFPHYELHITPDCSGVTQIFTFAGIAAIGVLSSASSKTRTLCVFLLALGLAWLANLARVMCFVFLVGIGWTKGVNDSWWHAGIGMCVYMPFVTVLVYVLLKTHRPIPHLYRDEAPSGRIAIGWLLLPLLIAATPQLLVSEAALQQPSYFDALERPPGHRLAIRATSEASDQQSYGTPWLINARFVDDAEQFFDLFHYKTISTSHLCVHHVPSCMYWPDQREIVAAPIVLNGVRWWRFGLDRPVESDSVHVYYSFEVDGTLRDDSIWTQFAVFGQRLKGGASPVGFTRISFGGSLPDHPTDYEESILNWFAGLALRGGD